MLKHAHSSPLKSSTSLRRNSTESRTPKHIRQTSSPSSICLSCSVDEETVHNDSFESETFRPFSSIRRHSNQCYKCFRNKSLRKYKNLSSSFTLNNDKDNTIVESDITSDQISSFSTTSLVNKRCLYCSRNNIERTTPDHKFNNESIIPTESVTTSKGYNSSSDSGNETESRLSTPCHPSPLPNSMGVSSRDNGSGRNSSRGITKVPHVRCDSLSLNSTMTYSSREDIIGSLSSSVLSLRDNKKHIAVRVWVRCLMQEMEYKTIRVSYEETSREVVSQLLSKFKMKHRDPNLYYLTIEITIRKAGSEVVNCVRLDDAVLPAHLIECHPQDHSRLALRMRRGGLIRIYDHAVCEGSYYKSLLVSEKITSLGVMVLILSCNNIRADPRQYAIYEVFHKEKKERVLEEIEEPMMIASEWKDRDSVRLEMRPLRAPKKTPNIITKEISSNRVPQKGCESSCLQESISKENTNNLTNSNIHLHQNQDIKNISKSKSRQPLSSNSDDKQELTPDSRNYMNIEAIEMHVNSQTVPIQEAACGGSNSEEQGEESTHNIQFKTYNDYENYFYI